MLKNCVCKIYTNLQEVSINIEIIQELKNARIKVLTLQNILLFLS